MNLTEHLHEHPQLPDHEHRGGRRREAVQAWLKIAILLGLGVYFAALVVSGNLQNYINPEFAWLSMIACVLFLALGLVNVYSLLKAYVHEHKHEEHDDHDSHDGHDYHESHNHSHITLPVLAVVAIPLVLGVLLPSRPLGTGAIDVNLGAGGSAGGGSAGAALPGAGSGAGQGAYAANQREWHIWDWQQSFQASKTPDACFTGQRADVTGFVHHQPELPPGHFILARFVMRHCAADAFGVGMLVAYDKAETLAPDTWVRVQGALRVSDVAGEPALVLHPATLDANVGEPISPYIYPRFNPYALP